MTLMQSHSNEFNIHMPSFSLTSRRFYVDNKMQKDPYLLKQINERKIRTLHKMQIRRWAESRQIAVIIYLNLSSTAAELPRKSTWDV